MSFLFTGVIFLLTLGAAAQTEPPASDTADFETDYRQTLRQAGLDFASGTPLKPTLAAELHDRESSRQRLRASQAQPVDGASDVLSPEGRMDEERVSKENSVTLDKFQTLLSDAIAAQKGPWPEEEPKAYADRVSGVAQRFELEAAEKKATLKRYVQSSAKKFKTLGSGRVSIAEGERSQEDAERAQRRVSEHDNRSRDTTRSVDQVANGWDRRRAEGLPTGHESADAVALKRAPEGVKSKHPTAADYSRHNQTLKTDEPPPSGALDGWKQRMRQKGQELDEAALRELEKANDPNANILSKTWHRAKAGTAAGGSAVTDLLRGDEQTVKRAAWGAAGGVAVVGAAAVAAPGAVAAMGVTGLGTSAAAAGGTALSAKAVAFTTGEMAMTAHGAVSGVGTAVDNPTAGNLAMAGATVAGGQAIRLAGKGVGVVRGTAAVERVASNADDVAQLARSGKGLAKAEAETANAVALARNAAKTEARQETGALVGAAERRAGVIESKAGTTNVNLPDAPPQIAQNPGIWSPGKVGDPTRNALGHWNKHKAEFPQFNNATEYVKGTKEFINNPPPGTLIKPSSVKPGETVFYNPTSNTMVIKGKDGVPKTMFKPDASKHQWSTNMDYFNAQ